MPWVDSLALRFRNSSAVGAVLQRRVGRIGAVPPQLGLEEGNVKKKQTEDRPLQLMPLYSGTKNFDAEVLSRTGVACAYTLCVLRPHICSSCLPACVMYLSPAFAVQLQPQRGRVFNPRVDYSRAAVHRHHRARQRQQ